jgi:predicted Fe-Mo cluster-binding NifX family protein
MTSLAQAGEDMKIAVAADGETLDARVDRVAAKTPYFLMFDEDIQAALRKATELDK